MSLGVAMLDHPPAPSGVFMSPSHDAAMNATASFRGGPPSGSIARLRTRRTEDCESILPPARSELRAGRKTKGSPGAPASYPGARSPSAGVS